MSGELREHRIKRLKMRSMRRGIKEMDLILSTYADRNLEGMEPAQLDLYDSLLHENDQDLYQWVHRADGRAGTLPDDDQRYFANLSKVGKNRFN